MRISSRTLQLQWLAAFQQQQAGVAATQRQISSGERFQTAGDDPAGAAQVVRLDAALARVAGYQENAETARRRLALGEDALDKTTTALDRARELLIQAGSATQNGENRTAIAGELREILAGVIGTANAQDGEGRFLFGGGVVKVAPFTGSGGDVAYRGDAAERRQRLSDLRQVAENDPGSRVFMEIREGNGTFSVATPATNTGTLSFADSAVVDRSQWIADDYTVFFTSASTWEASDGAGNVVTTGTYAPGDTITFRGASITFSGTPATGDRVTVGASRNQSLFRTLQDAIDALEGIDPGQPAGRARFQSALNSGLQDLDQALANVSLVRSGVGARLNAIETQVDTNADLELELTSSLSDVRDVDYAEAVSALERRLTALEAAQRAFARTQSFSLFDVL
jgi:flagellar hook-associated protein 3 FlgL